MAEDDFEKTLPPSERKLEKAREDGSTLKAPDLMFLIVAMLMGLSVWSVVSPIKEAWLTLWDWRLLWTREGGLNLALLGASIGRCLGLALGACFVSVFSAAMAAWALGGFVISSKAISLDLTRLDPMQKLSQMITLSGAQIIWPMAKGALALGVSAWGLRSFVVNVIDQGDPMWGAVKALMPLGVAFTLFALLDFFIQWHKRNKQLSMSLQEVKDEHRESEGDPHLKAKVRSMARARAKSRMMSAVSMADVVVVNPEHYLVALRWDPSQGGAPVVVAKGLDALALAMKKVAIQKGIPVLESPPFARALWKASKMDRPIPLSYFEPVAMLLAWAYSIKDGKKVIEPSLQVPTDV